METSKRIILTGMPGVGKTTLIKKICEKLSAENIKCSGFYTEELRDNNNTRVGFDIVSLENNRAKLARLSSQNTRSQFTVGKYEVYPREFENFALPLISNANAQVLVIDEVGKMELFSKKFEKEVDMLFKNKNNIILATIPVPKGKPIALVESIRHSKSCKVFQVDRSNRNSILDDIMKSINFE